MYNVVLGLVFVCFGQKITKILIYGCGLEKNELPLEQNFVKAVGVFLEELLSNQVSMVLLKID